MHQGDDFLQKIEWIGTQVQIECFIQKWQPIFQLGNTSESGIWWIKSLRWNCARTKLAIPNRNPEVTDDQFNSIHFYSFNFISSGLRHWSGRVIRIPRLIEQQNASASISSTKLPSIEWSNKLNFFILVITIKQKFQLIVKNTMENT